MLTYKDGWMVHALYTFLVADVFIPKALLSNLSEKISDQISLFSPRMAWHKKRTTVAAVCSAEHIQ